MTVFWIITATMIAVALALLAPTLLRRHATISDATERFNVEIARERLADLVREKEAGGLSDEEFEQAKRDLELALAQDLGDPAALATLHECVRTLTLLMAPIVPFVTEKVWQSLVRPTEPQAPASVHLASFPAAATNSTPAAPAAAPSTAPCNG